MSPNPPDRRKRNRDWLLNVDGNGGVSTADAQLAVLMDVRDELRKLSTLLGCPNFTGIPQMLRQIRRNTAKPRKQRANKAEP